MKAPLVTIVEAKSDNVKYGLGQCAATMVAAREFSRREGDEVPILFGAATTGTDWQFLRLQAEALDIDTREYHVEQLDKILGILVSMLSD